MKPLVSLHIGFYHNEAGQIYEKAEWHKKSGLSQWYVIDNESADETPYLARLYGAQCHSFSTNGLFDLPALQAEMFRVINQINPDWVVYLDADTIIETPAPLAEEIARAEVAGYDGIAYPCHNLQYDELGKIMVQKDRPLRIYVWRHKPGISFISDSMRYNNQRIEYNSDILKILCGEGRIINHGGLLPIAKREEEYQRRKLAWERGIMSRSEGAHLQYGHDNNWKYKSSELIQLTKEVTNE